MSYHDEAWELLDGLGRSWSHVLVKHKTGKAKWGSPLPRVIALLMKAKQRPGLWLELVTKAEQGDAALSSTDERRDKADADSALCWEAAEVIGCGGALSPPLRTYIQNLLFERSLSRNRRRGKDPYGFWVRNHFIIRAILHLCIKCELLPTRSPATDKESCCSIVSRWLRGQGFEINESGVEEVWGNREEYGVDPQLPIEILSKFVR